MQLCPCALRVMQLSPVEVKDRAEDMGAWLSDRPLCMLMALHVAQLAPYNTQYERLAAHMEEVGVYVEPNLWDAPVSLAREHGRATPDTPTAASRMPNSPRGGSSSSHSPGSPTSSSGAHLSHECGLTGRTLAAYGFPLCACVWVWVWGGMFLRVLSSACVVAVSRKLLDVTAALPFQIGCTQVKLSPACIQPHVYPACHFCSSCYTRSSCLSLLPLLFVTFCRCISSAHLSLFRCTLRLTHIAAMG